MGRARTARLARLLCTMMRALIILTLLFTVWLPGRAAMAHAVLLESSPSSGGLVAKPPGEIVLRFNEPVTPIAVTVIGREGRSLIPPDSAVARDTEVRAMLPSNLPNGSYIVSYRVVSADSHPVSGSFLFVVGTPSGAAPTAPHLQDQENMWAFLVILNRIVLLAGLLFSAGGVLFAVSMLGGEASLNAPLRRPVRIGAIIVIASAFVAVALQGGLLTAAQMDAAATWQSGAILSVGWHSTLGTSAALIAFGMLLVVLFFGRGRKRIFLWLSAAGAILAAGALAASGHAATAPPRWLATPTMAMHGLMIAFWAGSLWALLHLLRLHGTHAADVVLRFSRMAVVAVAILVITGLTLATLQLGGDLTSLVSTPYGQLLLLKLAVVALLLLLATYNKFRLTPALIRGNSGSAERLARAIRLEIAAVCLILAVTALLGQAPPPRALAAMADSAALHGGSHAASSQNMTAKSKGYSARVQVKPATVGRNTLLVELRGPDGAPFEALEASADISLPEQGIEPLAVPLHSLSGGRYEGTTDSLIRPGQWQLGLDVLINDFERVNFDFTLPIGTH